MGIMRCRGFVVLVGACLVAGALPSAALAVSGYPTRVSVSEAKAQAVGHDSMGSSVTEDGHYVAFHSRAANLVPRDWNGRDDIFVRDRLNGFTSIVSIAGYDTGNGDSQEPSISANGRYVVFSSMATNFVARDWGGKSDVFVHDRLKSTTTLASIGASGTSANGDSFAPSISADGRYVAFESDANNIVANDTNDECDVFVHDRQTGKTTRASVTSAGAEANGASWAPKIAANGRFIVFESYADNLVANDTNEDSDVFVHHRGVDTTRVSVSDGELQADAWSGGASISADGRFVSFDSDASNLVTGDTNEAPDVFLRDRQSGATTRASVNSAGAQHATVAANSSLTDDGRFVTFATLSPMTAGDTNDAFDIYIRDTVGHSTTLASSGVTGSAGNGECYSGVIAGNASCIVFGSDATNIVSDDTNGRADVFARQLKTLPTALTATVTAKTVEYGTTPRINGTLRRSSSSGQAINMAHVRLQRKSGSAWVEVTSLWSSFAGAVSFWDTPRHKTVYRLTYLGDGEIFAPAASAWVSITPKVSLTAPVAPRAMKRARYYTLYGSLKPHHTEGTKPVRVYKWRKVNGKWKSYGYVKATAYDYKHYTRYKVKMRLTTRGTWRLRAYAPGDSTHAATWSDKYDYVTVK